MSILCSHLYVYSWFTLHHSSAHLVVSSCAVSMQLVISFVHFWSRLPFPSGFKQASNRQPLYAARSEASTPLREAALEVANGFTPYTGWRSWLLGSSWIILVEALSALSAFLWLSQAIKTTTAWTLVRCVRIEGPLQHYGGQLSFPEQRWTKKLRLAALKQAHGNLSGLWWI